MTAARLLIGAACLAAAGGLISPHSPPCPAVPRRKSARHVARVAQHPARA